MAQANVETTQVNLVYEVLDASNKDLLHDTAECLAETFTGVQVGNAFVSEPVIMASKLSKETFQEFIVEYLNTVASHGLTIIARDKDTGKIRGAVAAESYNPEEELPIFEGEFEILNKVLELCVILDEGLVEFVQSKTGKKVGKDEHIHLFLIGVKLEKDKKQVGCEMVKLLEKVGKEKGYKSIFAEATNFRSQKLFVDYLNFTVPRNNEGNPIVYTYADDELYKETISENIALECQLVYKSLE